MNKPMQMSSQVL